MLELRCVGVRQWSPDGCGQRVLQFVYADDASFPSDGTTYYRVGRADSE